MSDPSTGYLICHWSERALAVIIQLQSKLLRAEGDVLIEVIDSAPPDPALLPPAYAEFMENVRFIRGNPADPNVLDTVDLLSKRCVILLASSDNADQADAETLLTLEAIRAARSREGSNLRALAEILDPAHRRYLQHMVRDGGGWVEVLTAQEVEAHIFSQASRIHGMASFYFDLLSFSAETNEAYRVPVPSDLVGATFSAAFVSLRATTTGPARQLAVGVARRGGVRIETNPDDSEPLREDDELVVFAFEPPMVGTTNSPQEA